MLALRDGEADAVDRRHVAVADDEVADLDPRALASSTHAASTRNSGASRGTAR